MASASKIKAGEAFIQISADSTEFQKSLTGLQKGFDNIALHAGKVGLALSAMGGSVLAPITLATKQFATMGDTLDKMSGRTGASTEDLSALGYVATQSGSSLEGVNKAAKALYGSLDSAARGSKDTIAAFEELGVKASDFVGLPLSRQLGLISSGMSRLASDEQRATVASNLLGRAGYELLPMLKSGSAEVDRLTKRAKELGVVMSGEDAAAAAALNDAFTDLQYSTQGLSASIGVAMAPMAQAFTDAATDAVAFVSAIIRSKPEIVQFVAVVASATAALGSFGLAAAGAGKGLTFALGGLKSFVGILAKVGIGALTAKFVALAAAAALVGYGVKKAYDYMDRVEDERSNPKADPDHVARIDRDIRQTRRDRKSEGDIGLSMVAREAGLVDQIAANQAAQQALREQLDQRNEAALAGVPLSDDDMAALTAISEELNGLESDAYSLKKELASVRESMVNLSRGITGQGDAFKPLQEQAAAFNNVLDETKKKLSDLQEARNLKAKDRNLALQIDIAPLGAKLEITESLNAAQEEVDALSKKLQRLEEDFTRADRDTADSITAQLTDTMEKLEEAIKQRDGWEEWERKAQAAIASVQRRADGLQDAFDSITTDVAARQQARDFKEMIDSGNWQDANETVLAEMAAVEREWAKNTADIAEAMAEAARGNADAVKAVEKLLAERRDLADRRETSLGRQGQVDESRQSADAARLNVLKRLDPERFRKEFADISRDMARQVEEAVAKAMDAEARGENASAFFTMADKLWEKWEDMKNSSSLEDDMSRNAWGGTYSAAVAERMGGVDLQRQQLDATKGISRTVDDLLREVRRGGGGLGI